ncbi:MAG: DUF721 domain-containing protein [Treponema sp.]|jgi:hypothetical protein|nr:DUF721 domain-containing protein [Treponema sp.]
MKRVGDLISSIFDEKFVEKTKGYSKLFDCWEDLMVKNGIAAAAGHSWIKNAEKGLVWIEVDHPGWKQILQTKESKLLHDFKYRFPDMGISGISIFLCKPGTGNREESREQTPTKLAREGKREESAAASPAVETGGDKYGAIKDEALRALLVRLEKRIAERDKEQ